MDIPSITAPTIAIADRADRFPVRRIFCVGQNYADHAREMGSDPSRDPPFFFTKPGDAVVEDGARIPYPPQTADLHHEVELVLAIGREGVDVPSERAAECLFGHAVGIDLTRRDLQAIAKKKGRPWDMSKGFDRSAPVGALRLGPPPANGAITLSVNGTQRQAGNLSDMVWSPTEIVSILSGYVTLMPGDLIFTGTPAGVGAIQRGDTVAAQIEGIGTLSASIG